MQNDAQRTPESSPETEPVTSRSRRALAIGRTQVRPSAARVWLFTAALGLTAAVLYVDGVRTLEPVASPFSFPWPLLAVAFLAVETKVILVHFRRETHSFSLSEVPAVIGLGRRRPPERSDCE